MAIINITLTRQRLDATIKKFNGIRNLKKRLATLLKIDAKKVTING